MSSLSICCGSELMFAHLVSKDLKYNLFYCRMQYLVARYITRVSSVPFRCSALCLVVELLSPFSERMKFRSPIAQVANEAIW